MNKLTVRIETTPIARSLLPWVATARRGRQSIESQCFALLGYPETELAKLQSAALEHIRDILTDAVRLLGAFEYIPKDPSQLDAFFEKKIVSFEAKLRDLSGNLPPLHAAIGVTQNSRILFATSGEILALQITPATIMNLGDAAYQGPLHFETFREGTLGPRAHLLFIPKVIGTTLKSDELKNLHLAKSSERKLEYLEHLWEKRMALPGSFRAVLLETKPNLVKDAETTAVSIAQLLSTEAKTEALLSPPLLRPLAQFLKSISLKLIRSVARLAQLYRREAEEKSPPRPPYAALTAAAPRTLSSALMRISTWGKYCVLRASRRLRLGLTERLRLALAQLKGAAFIGRFNALSARNKLFAIAIALLVFLSAQGILLTIRHNRLSRADEALAGEVSAIRTLIDGANAAVLYDEGAAQLKAEEAKTRLERFDEFQKEIIALSRLRSLRGLNSTITEETLAQLRAALGPVQNALRHVITVDRPNLLDESAAEALGLRPGPHRSAKYRQRLYELHPEENQIYKYESVKAGFGPGVPWITDAASVQNTVSLAIDGSIYVLHASGGVSELLKGVRTAFAVKPIDPPFIRPVKIWTDERSAYLYILDAGESRLAVFAKKDGVFKAQYKSESFVDLQDFSIDESKKTAYLLNGEAVFSIPLSHL